MSVVYNDDECVLFDLKSWFAKFLDGSNYENLSEELLNITTAVCEPYFGIGKRFGPQTKLKYNILRKLKELKGFFDYFPYIPEKDSLNCIFPADTTQLYNNLSAVSEYHNCIGFQPTFINMKYKSILVKNPYGSYILPPFSIFHSCDIFKLNIKDFSNENFDFIIVDPPWANKSVSRSSSYNSSVDLMRYLPTLGVAKMLKKTSGFLFLWVTNNVRYQQYVLCELLPQWNLSPLGCFVYVKLTTKGEPIFDVDSVHRQPYEYCLVCVVNEWSDSFGYSQTKRSCHELPIIKYFFMIQPSMHSLKPPLQDYLKIWCPGNCGPILELYSRYPAPNTVSFGNEIITPFTN